MFASEGAWHRFARADVKRANSAKNRNKHFFRKIEERKKERQTDRQTNRQIGRQTMPYTYHIVEGQEDETKVDGDGIVWLFDGPCHLVSP